MSRYQSHSFWNWKDSKTSLINQSGQIIDLASEIFENKNIEVVELILEIGNVTQFKAVTLNNSAFSKTSD